MWFQDIAQASIPAKPELQKFVVNTRRFLKFVLDEKVTFGFLWTVDPKLRKAAVATFDGDISKGAGLQLDQAIPNLTDDQLKRHGLSGRPLRFKIQVLNAVANQWNNLQGVLSIGEWLKKTLDAIDAILDSLIDAAGGAGGLIKEFKDALRALA